MFDFLSKNIEGANIPVKTANGGVAKRIYFNSGATSLALSTVVDTVRTNIPFITYKDAPCPLGERNTQIYENVRKVILEYVGGDANNDTVVYVDNSTQGINLIADLFYQEDPDQIIITTAMEHMANYLPFATKFKTSVVGITKEGDLDLEDMEDKLKRYSGKVKLVSVTGASNVTGITPPIYAIARLVHRYGAKLLVDAVQLIQHQPFCMKANDVEEHIDFIVFSSHKCYSPFDGGGLVGPFDFLVKFFPYLNGAGTTKFVSKEKIIFSNPPSLYEAGYPDLFGIMAMGVALKYLENLGLDKIAEYEKKLFCHAKAELSKMSRVRMYGQESENINIPFISFNLEGYNHEEVAKYLGYEHGIEVGSGVLGADIYIQALLGISSEEAYTQYLNQKTRGVIRISMGMYNTVEEIDRLISALAYL